MKIFLLNTIDSSDVFFVAAFFTSLSIQFLLFLTDGFFLGIILFSSLFKKSWNLINDSLQLMEFNFFLSRKLL